MTEKKQYLCGTAADEAIEKFKTMVEEANANIQTRERNWNFRSCAERALGLLDKLPPERRWQVLDICDQSSKYTFIWTNTDQNEDFDYRACTLEKLPEIFLSVDVSQRWKCDVLATSMDRDRATMRGECVPFLPLDDLGWNCGLNPASEILLRRLMECDYGVGFPEGMFRHEMERLERYSPGVVRNTVDRYGNNALIYHHYAYWRSNDVNCHYAGWGSVMAYEDSLVLEEFGCDITQANQFGISRTDLRYGAIEEIRRFGGE